MSKTNSIRETPAILTTPETTDPRAHGLAGRSWISAELPAGKRARDSWWHKYQAALVERQNAPAPTFHTDAHGTWCDACGAGAKSDPSGQVHICPKCQPVAAVYRHPIAS